MTTLPALDSFLREHPPKERNASPHICEAYAHSFQLLVCFAADRLKVRPSQLEIERLDAPLILSFLEHLERKRSNSARTRNARLAATNAFFRFLEYRLPSCLDQARRIHAIPMKKADQALVSYLTRDELQALLDAPDPRTASGMRDRAMLHLLRRGPARVRSWSAFASIRSTVIACPVCTSSGRASRACPAALEGDRDRPEGLAQGTRREHRSGIVCKRRHKQ